MHGTRREIRAKHNWRLYRTRTCSLALIEIGKSWYMINCAISHDSARSKMKKNKSSAVLCGLVHFIVDRESIAVQMHTRNTHRPK